MATFCLHHGLQPESENTADTVDKVLVQSGSVLINGGLVGIHTWVGCHTDSVLKIAQYGLVQ